MAKNVKMKELVSLIRTNKRITALFICFIITLILLIVLTISLTCTIKKTADNTANDIFDKWVDYELNTIKYSTTFCNKNKYSISGDFNDNNCFTDCAMRCLSIGYKYKNHFQSGECDFGCGCECV